MAAADARTLARGLAARSDASLAALFEARHVSPSAPWNDAFDAAEALLDPASVARAIVDLTAAEAAALRSAAGVDAAGAGPVAAGPAAAGPVAAGPERDALAARALLDDDGRPWEVVVQALPAHAVTADVEAPDDPDLADAADGMDDAADSDAAAAERAFTAVSSLADVLQTALTTPLGRIGAGTLGATERRRLIETGAVSDPAAADELVAIAEQTGLLAGEGRVLLVTADGLAWLRTSTLGRWTRIAERLLAALPPGVRPEGAPGIGPNTTTGTGWRPLPQWTEAYPFDASWPARARHIATLLRRWAVLGADDRPPAWTLAAADGGALEPDRLAELLPPEVDRVYLQNDLTAIAPGSLAPELDLRLRSMARRESRAQASSYRFTAETLADALTAGETAETLRTFLEQLSLTGLPQPLAYEIERTANRHGALRVGPDGAGRTRITSDDEALLRTIAVDQALRPLGLVSDGDALITRSSPDTAFWMVADARYPVVAVDADGQRRALDRHRLAADTEPQPTAEEVYADLIARLRAAQEGDADAAWLGRELEQAVRARETIVVAVRLPDGTEREFTIEATGLGGGRLRGLDRLVDVERTLPVSSITRVGPA